MTLADGTDHYDNAQDLLHDVAYMQQQIELGGQVGKGTAEERAAFVRAATEGLHQLLVGRFGTELADGIIKEAQDYRQQIGEELTIR